MKITFEWPREKGRQTLDRLVADQLTSRLGVSIGRGRARTACEEGYVLVNGRRALGSLRRPTGAVKVEVSWTEGAVPTFVFDQHWIVAESDGLLAVRKPHGLLTHATADKSRQNLVDLLRQARADLSDLTLHHRLDKETSGLVLFSTSREVRVSVAQQFEARQVEKEYLCWVQGKRLDSHWVEEAPLRDRSGRVSVGPGQSARTEFQLLQRRGGYCLLSAKPTTGRKHQIRAHLAHRGLPIVGDTLFGGEAHPRLLLHAFRLQLEHPVKGETLHLKAEPDQSFTVQAKSIENRKN